MASNITNWFVNGKICIVTGSNTGIGKTAAQELVRRGAKKVILACRNVEKAEEARQDIIKNTCCKEDQVQVRQIDLSSIKSVRKFAAEVNNQEPEVHVLVNNAGLFGSEKRSLSVDGNEMCFATNHLGHFLLTNLLLDKLKQSAPSRIVNVAAHKVAFWLSRPGFHIDDVNFDKPGAYSAVQAYSQTKLANVLFTRELHRRLQENGANQVTTYSLFPGVIKTEIDRGLGRFWKTMFNWFGTTAENGAKTTVYCASQPGIENLSGKYFS